MFGEVVTVRKKPAFGNLMTARIRIASPGQDS
jgi:hypothetical protein